MKFLFVVETDESTHKLRFQADTLEHVKEQLQNKLGESLRSEKGLHVEVYDTQENKFVPVKKLEDLPNVARIRVRGFAEAFDDNNATKLAKPCLALPWKEFSLDFSQGEMTIMKHPIYIEQVDNAGLGTGLSIWDGSVVLAKYLEHALSDQIRGAQVLELGAGTGLVGISAAVLGAKRVVLSDLAYALPNIERNIGLNAKSIQTVVVAQTIDWFKNPEDVGEFQYILASDVVWIDELIDPLVTTMERLCRRQVRSSSSLAPIIFMSYQSRSTMIDVHLMEALATAGFSVQSIDHLNHHPMFTSTKIHIYKIIYRLYDQ